MLRCSTPRLAVHILVSLTLAACAASYPRDPDSAALPAGAESAASGAAAPAADGGAATECRGPGRYETGKEGSYRPCCGGLREVAGRSASYTTNRSGDNIPICADPPLRIDACVRGVCGDGICETGESGACGCVADCPDAAWELPPDTLSDAGVPIDGASGLSARPKSCGDADLVAQLQTSADAIDCGNLPVDASGDAKSAALTCARAALAASKPFQLFWRTRGTDSINHRGVVARLEADVLHVYSLILIAANSFGSDTVNETASWVECNAFAPSTCTSGPAECLGCTSRSDLECMCSNDANAAATEGVSVRCSILLD